MKAKIALLLSTIMLSGCLGSTLVEDGGDVGVGGSGGDVADDDSNTGGDGNGSGDSDTDGAGEDSGTGEGGNPPSSTELADALNFANMSDFVVLSPDQIPQGSVRYDGLAGIEISDSSGSLGDTESDDGNEGIVGTMSADVSFADNTAVVEIGNLAVYQVRDTDEFAEEFDALEPADVVQISEVSGGFAGSGGVLVDFDDESPDPAVLSGDMSGSFSDGTTFSVAGDLNAELSVAFDDASETTLFLLFGEADAGDTLDIEVDGAATEDGSVEVSGLGVEGGF